MTTILFPAHPLDPRQVDPDFAEEALAASCNGFEICRLRLEPLLEGDAQAAVRSLLPPPETEDCLYRGWMVSVSQYECLYEALAARGFRLLTSPQEYRRHHEFPGSHAAVGDLMPASLTLPGTIGLDPQAIVALAASQLGGSAIVKDFVKSRKHEWLDACYIPDLADRANAVRVVSNFIERQGAGLQGGLVFHRFVPLRPVGRHPKSGFPIPLEFRSFFLGGSLLTTSEYWHELEYHEAAPDSSEVLSTIAKKMGDGFYTADTAVDEAGRWVVIEIGDAQVSQIPEKLPIIEFYRLLFGRLASLR